MSLDQEMKIKSFRTVSYRVRPAHTLVRPLALANGLALIALAAPSPAAPAQAVQDPPQVHFAASGEYSFSSARITVDVRLEAGARLEVTLTAPSGRTETLPMDRVGNRHSWTGQLKEAGTWRAGATVSGVGSPQSAGATVSLDEGTPTCALAISGPEQPTQYLSAEFVVNSCDASAVTGAIATRFITVLQDGARISTLDASERCERRFILPGDGAYEATVQIADDRGVAATCSSADLAVDALYPRYWPIFDVATGTYKSGRTDIPSSPEAAWVGGGALGISLPHDSAADRTTVATARVGAGFAHNYWTGSTAEVIVTRQSPGGFFGAGAGVWGIGDTDILDGVLFGTAGFNLPSYTGAGQAQAFAEFRLFARHVSAPQDNFSGIVGVRFNFKRTHQLQAR
ncbi:MAG: hypothetical protein OXE58_08385 [Acidobacteria bacterium]|nr:hypothetical protein [Acidobacteriota bacterium]